VSQNKCHPEPYPCSWEKGSAGILPVLVGILPTSFMPSLDHRLVTGVALEGQRQDAVASGLEGRAPHFLSAWIRLNR
jgi:hypothetical protein